MAFALSVEKLTLNFKFPAGTSRGTLHQRDTWFLKLAESANEKKFGIGEASPIWGLSEELESSFDAELKQVVDRFNSSSITKVQQLSKVVDEIIAPNMPSVKFALETAIYDYLNGCQRIVFDNDFVKGKMKIPINGLIWMGDKVFMIKQINQKMKSGFKCLKIKVGAMDFVTECEVLEYIREQYFNKKIELRLDANGAFSIEEAYKKLEILSGFNLHSIEQPIAPGHRNELAELVKDSPVPIALDEELIGVHGLEKKMELLSAVNPQYIILKPSLLGGFKETREWIELAEAQNIGWWITSALESNIGLNALAQFTAEFDPDIIHGLGTGELYHNNIDSPLEINQGYLLANQAKNWSVQ